MEKSIIICAGDKSSIPLAATQVRSILRHYSDVHLRTIKLRDTMVHHVPALFGLMFSGEHYADGGAAATPEFFGFSYDTVNSDLDGLMRRYGGSGVYGRIAGRVIRFDTQNDTFLIEGYDTPESLTAISMERALEGREERVLFIWIKQRDDLEAHFVFQLKHCRHQVIPFGANDPEMMALLIRGTLQTFLNLEPA